MKKMNNMKQATNTYLVATHHGHMNRKGWRSLNKCLVIADGAG